MKILELVESVWVGDIGTIVWIFHRWWAYTMVPIVFYFMFLALKWLLISLPIWLPLVTILQLFTGTPTNHGNKHTKS